jgi:hypothetical protein
MTQHRGEVKDPRNSGQSSLKELKVPMASKQLDPFDPVSQARVSVHNLLAAERLERLGAMVA